MSVRTDLAFACHYLLYQREVFSLSLADITPPVGTDYARQQALCNDISLTEQRICSSVARARSDMITMFISSGRTYLDENSFGGGFDLVENLLMNVILAEDDDGWGSIETYSAWVGPATRLAAYRAAQADLVKKVAEILADALRTVTNSENVLSVWGAIREDLIETIDTASLPGLVGGDPLTDGFMYVRADGVRELVILVSPELCVFTPLGAFAAFTLDETTRLSTVVFSTTGSRWLTCCSTGYGTMAYIYWGWDDPLVAPRVRVTNEYPSYGAYFWSGEDLGWPTPVPHFGMPGWPIIWAERGHVYVIAGDDEQCVDLATETGFTRPVWANTIAGVTDTQDAMMIPCGVIRNHGIEGVTRGYVRPQAGPYGTGWAVVSGTAGGFAYCSYIGSVLVAGLAAGVVNVYNTETGALRGVMSTGLSGVAQWMVSVGSYLYVVDSIDGLHLFRVTSSVTLVHVRTIDALLNVVKMRRHGDELLVVGDYYCKRYRLRWS